MPPYTCGISYYTDSVTNSVTTAGNCYFRDNYFSTADTTGSLIFTPSHVIISHSYASAPSIPQSVHRETAAERRAREARQLAFEEENRKRREAYDKAETKAKELLKEFIGLEAFGLLYEVGYIEVDSRKYKGRKYRVPKNPMAYIEIMDEKGAVIDTLCVHPKTNCPPADHILTRVAMLQNDEKVLLKAANHWGKRESSYYEN